MKDLIPLSENQALEAFKTEGGLEPLLVRIEAHCRAQPQVLNTENGRANVKSLARKVASTKTTIEAMGKKLQEPYQAEIEKILAGRKNAWKRLEDLQKELTKPLDEWQAAEDARIKAHEDAILSISELALWPDEIPQPSSKQIQKRIAEVNAKEPRNYEEYGTRAARITKETLEALEAQLNIALAREAEEAETAVFLKLYAQAERENEDFDLARAVAEEATRLAQEAAKIDLVWEKAHRDNAEWDKAKAEERNRIQAEEAENTYWHNIFIQADLENKAFDAAIQAEKDKLEAAKEATRKEKLAACAATAAAAAAEKKRKEDEAHKTKINNEAIDVIEPIIADVLEGDYLDTGEAAYQIIKAISEGKVPNVTIKY